MTGDTVTPMTGPADDELDADDVSLEDVVDELPEDLDRGFVGPYEFPDNKRRRVPGMLYLGIGKQYEPLLLVPIGFGGILSNIPGVDIAVGEGVLHQFYVMGIETGIDLDKLVECSRRASSFVGHDLPSKYLKAHLGKQARERRRQESRRKES